MGGFYVLFLWGSVCVAFGAASHLSSSTLMTRRSVVAFTTRLLVRPVRYYYSDSSHHWRVTPYASRNRCSGRRQHLTRMDNNDNDDNSSTRGGERMRDRNMESSATNIQYERSHASTICMVPPPVMEEVWQQLTRARTELRDPGLYRWPPHANLMYPFIDSKHFQKDDVLEKLQRVASQTQPFVISLDKFGTFGGKDRGVLWLYPHSYYDDDNLSEHTVVAQHDDNHSDNDEKVTVTVPEMEKNMTKEPLVALQALLEEQFPSQQQGAAVAKRPFAPHMTLSHYPSQQEALEALAHVESWWTPQRFVVNEIYVLVRDGDNGQFQRAITIPLGNCNRSNSNSNSNNNNNNTLMVHHPTLPFPGMPKVEEDWVREERMKLKKRRNGRGGRPRRSQTNDTRKVPGGSPRRPSMDTPEEIAAKRAARKAKRERLLQQDEKNNQMSNPLDDP